MRFHSPIVQLTLAALAAAATWLLLAPRGEAAGGGRTYTATAYLLTLDGAEAGMVKSMSSTTTSAPPAAKGAKPQLTGTIELQFGLGMKPSVYGWIDANLKQKRDPKSGAVVTIDATGKATQQLEFSNARVTEFTIPTLDAASKTAGDFTLKLAGNVRNAPPAGAKAGSIAVKQKVWTTANFQLDIEGLDCKRVMKIEALTFREQPSSTGATGLLQVPLLKVTSGMAAIQSWQSWQQLAMEEGQDQAKTGKIVLLAPDLKTVLAEIKLNQLGIQALRQGGAANTDTVAKFEADLYFESAELSVPGAK